MTDARTARDELLMALLVERFASATFTPTRTTSAALPSVLATLDELAVLRAERAKPRAPRRPRSANHSTTLRIAPEPAATAAQPGGAA